MNRTLTISAISIIAAVMVLSVVSPALANNGNNGCENANPNAKSCESNPNTTPLTCPECFDVLLDGYDACLAIPLEERTACFDEAVAEYHICESKTDIGACEPVPPAPR